MNVSESSNMRKIRQSLAKSLLLILLSAALGTGLLILSELLPAGPMDRHLADSAEIFRDTGKYPSLYTWCTSRLDNDSDAKLLQMAAKGISCVVYGKSRILNTYWLNRNFRANLYPSSRAALFA